MVRTTALLVATLALVLGVSSATTAQTTDPNQKKTVTDIQYRISYSQEVPGNCAILGFSQWEASKFKGWVATNVSITYASGGTSGASFPVSPPPKYDDELKYGGNVVSPPNGSHWVLIGDGSFRAGPPPADPECQEMLARSRAVIKDGKVTTTFRRTDACAKKLDTLTKAQKARKKAKSKKAKSKTQKALTKAQKAFSKDCSK